MRPPAPGRPVRGRPPPGRATAGTAGRAADPHDGEFARIAVFGGVYNNHRALEALIEDAGRRGAEAIFCLGDLGGFGPHPYRVFPLLAGSGVRVVQGNYDHSIGHDLDDCACGYTDPRDNHFARVSYDYTRLNTPQEWKPWLRSLPPRRRLALGGLRVLLCHGSPRRTNEFLWDSTTSTHFLHRFATNFGADVIVASHTGLPWTRFLEGGPGPPGWWVNAGVIGRPANDGSPSVRYALLGAEAGVLQVELLRLDYDHEGLAREMESEGIPSEFVETIRTGWWTTCLEVLPQKERRLGRF